MGLHNAISRGILTDAVKRILGIQKSEGGIERFSETLDIVLDITDTIVHPEWAVHRNELLAGRGQTIAAGGAGQFGGASVTLAAASKKLAVITHASFSVGATAEVSAGRDTATALAALFASGLATTGRDGRIAASNPTQTAFSYGTSASFPANNLYRQLCTANTPYDLHELIGCVISPGMGYAIQCFAANTLINVTFCWREWSALPGELI